MKTLSILFAASVLLSGSAAQAETLDLRKLTCGDFAKGDSHSNTTVAVWLSGHYVGNNDEAIIDFDKVNNLGNALVKYCAANPKMMVSDAAEKIMGKGK